VPSTAANFERSFLRRKVVKNGSEQGYGMAEKNVYQVADWNGQSGERWVAYQARLDAMMGLWKDSCDFYP
jgi:hypothetical protein